MLRVISAIAWTGLLMCANLAAQAEAAQVEAAQAGDAQASAEPRTDPAAAPSSEPPAGPPAAFDELESVTVFGRVPTPTELVSQRVIDAAELLREMPLHYTYVRRFWRESLRGRPVIFAAWSELSQSWHVVEIEMPFPAPRWRPGRRLAFRVLTPDYEAVHVRGVGTERLMFEIYRNDERLRVYGRKYPMIELPVVKKQGVRNAVASAAVTHYLPQTDDAAPLFISQGRALLRLTAESALSELRESRVQSFAYPGKLLADVVLPETLISLAVIEQTDDGDFKTAPTAALNRTVGQYGLMQSQAFTYSVSNADAAGPMQFTDRRGRGTYSMVVRRCADADISPDFNSGARDLQNAMKAAACLLDLVMSEMPREVQSEYSQRPGPLSVFSVAAYNGGGRNATKLLRAVRRLRATLADLRIPETTDFEFLTTRCPCLWMDRGGQTTSLTIPAYNRENMGYIDKYLRFMSMMQESKGDPTPPSGPEAIAAGTAPAASAP
jgi:hypothetical protein